MLVVARHPRGRLRCRDGDANSEGLEGPPGLMLAAWESMPMPSSTEERFCCAKVL